MFAEKRWGFFRAIMTLHNSFSLKRGGGLIFKGQLIFRKLQYNSHTNYMYHLVYVMPKD